MGPLATGIVVLLPPLLVVVVMVVVVVCWPPAIVACCWGGGEVKRKEKKKRQGSPMPPSPSSSSRYPSSWWSCVIDMLVVVSPPLPLSPYLSSWSRTWALPLLRMNEQKKIRGGTHCRGRCGHGHGQGRGHGCGHGHGRRRQCHCGCVVVGMVVVVLWWWVAVMGWDVGGGGGGWGWGWLIGMWLGHGSVCTWPIDNIYLHNEPRFLWRVSPGGWHVKLMGPRGCEFDSRPQHIFLTHILIKYGVHGESMKHCLRSPHGVYVDYWKCWM